jgi:hypothetical protein
MAKPKLQSYIRPMVTFVETVNFGTVEITGSGATDYQLVYNKPTYTSTRTDLIMFILPRKPVGANACKIIITGVNSSNAFGAGTASDEMTVPALSAKNLGILVTKSGTDPIYWKSVSSVSLDGTSHGTAGEQYDIIGVPKWNDTDADGSDGFVELIYVTSEDITPGATRMPVANRMDAVYDSIDIRPDNTFTMAQRYVTNNWVHGIGRLRGRKVTILLELREDGGALVAEYIYLGNACFNEAPIAAPDNGDMTVNATGYFEVELHYEP